MVFVTSVTSTVDVSVKEEVVRSVHVRSCTCTSYGKCFLTTGAAFDHDTLFPCHEQGLIPTLSTVLG